MKSFEIFVGEDGSHRSFYRISKTEWVESVSKERISHNVKTFARDTLMARH